MKTKGNRKLYLIRTNGKEGHKHHKEKLYLIEKEDKGGKYTKNGHADKKLHVNYKENDFGTDYADDTNYNVKEVGRNIFKFQNIPHHGREEVEKDNIKNGIVSDQTIETEKLNRTEGAVSGT